MLLIPQARVISPKTAFLYIWNYVPRTETNSTTTPELNCYQRI